MLNRRAFLQSGLSSFALSRSVLGLGTVYATTPARAELTTLAILQMAAIAAQLISKFASKDGGSSLQAYLTSIRDLQVKTIEILNGVLEKLDTLHDEINKIPTKIDGLLDSRELAKFNSLFLAANRELREVVTLDVNKESFTAAQRSRLETKALFLRNRIVEARQVLMSTPSIASTPHAAMLMAIVLPIEVSARRLNNEEPKLFSIAFDDYDEWRRTMFKRGDPKSVASFAQFWLEQLQATSTKATSLPYNTQSYKGGKGHTTDLLFKPPHEVKACYDYTEYQPERISYRCVSCCGFQKIDCGEREYANVRTQVERTGKTTRIDIVVNSSEKQFGSAKWLDIQHSSTHQLETETSWQCENFKGPFAHPDSRKLALETEEQYVYKRQLDQLKALEAAVALRNVAWLNRAIGRDALETARSLKVKIASLRDIYGK